MKEKIEGTIKQIADLVAKIEQTYNSGVVDGFDEKYCPQFLFPIARCFEEFNCNVSVLSQNRIRCEEDLKSGYQSAKTLSVPQVVKLFACFDSKVLA